MPFKALPGFRDFFPEEFALRAHIFDAMRRVARRYAFEEYDGPPLESLELYTGKSGDEITGQLYGFTDKGGRDVALRPEMTPTLARMVAERANGLRKPIRWFSIPQLFRYERQQRGRLREHFQLNCDLIGEAGPLGDAEIIALSIDVMRALGLTAADVRVRLSDRRLLAVLLEEIGIGAARQTLAFHALDKLGRSEYATRKRALQEDGASDDAIGRLEKLPEIRTWADLEESYPAAASAGEPLHRTMQALDAMGLGEFVDLDLTIVRGLAYYTGTVFELFDAQKALRAICGGGRYDDLLERVGGVNLPALGFGMGDVVLGELLKARGKMPSLTPTLDCWVAYDEGQRAKAMEFATKLRRSGQSVEYALHPVPLGKQIEAASKSGARSVVIFKADGSATERDLATKSEKPFSFGDG